MDVYSYIESSRSSYAITELCAAFGVSESGYHAHRNRPICKRRLADESLAKRIEAIHIDSRKTYGSPRIHDSLADEGTHVGRNRVCRLMRERGIDARPRKKRVYTTDSKHKRGVAKNLLNRAFKAAKPNTVWVGDITYVETKQGWLYLATVIDLYARKVVGYALDKSMPDCLVLKALARALAIRETPDEFMFHSDRGSQYASKNFRACLKDNGIVPSMSRKGNCWDNAVAESFFATLEKDVLMRNTFQTRDQARATIIDYIENFYNPVRKHIHNDNKSPNQAEQMFKEERKAARAA